MKACPIIPAIAALLFASGAAHASGRIPPAAAGSAPSQAASASRFATARAEAQHSGDVIEEAEHWLGSRNMTGKGGAWCAHFASYVLQRTGHRPLPSGMASSALNYGHRLSGPKVGALAVVTTRIGYAAHVGFVSNVNTDGTIELISGNWGRRVSNVPVSRRSVVAFIDVM